MDGKPPVRVLILTVPLPSADCPNTMAPLARQIASLRDLGIHVDVLEVRGMSKLKYLQAIPALRTLATQVDLVHAHYGYCGWLGRLQLRKPLVVSFMGDDLLGTPDETGRLRPLSRLVMHLDRWFAYTAQAVIVKSAEMAEVLKPIQAHVVPNGVDLHAFHPMPPQKARTVLGWPEGKRYILFPGDPDNPRKQFSLARAVVTQAARHLQAPLELVPLKRVPPTHVPLYMNACDAMTMTSYIEGSPNVVKEAMACNLPIVSVPVGDTPELLRDVSGYVVCPRDVTRLAAALVQVLTQTPRVAGRAAILHKGLDVMSIAKRLHHIYTEVIKQHARHPLSRMPFSRAADN